MKEVTENLFEQLKQMKAHGIPLLAIAGANKFVALDDGLQFFVKSPNRKINKVVIKYDAGQDLYNMELWNIRMQKGLMDMNYEASGIDVEQLQQLLVQFVVDGRPLEQGASN